MDSLDRFAFIIGPLLGGFLVDSVSWRLVFAINVLPIAVCLWLIKKVETKDLVKKTKLDVGGALLCSLGLSGAVFGLIEKPHYGWHNPIILGPLLGGLVSLLIFILYERRMTAS